MCSEFIAQGKLHLVEDAPAFQRTAYAVYHEGNDKKAFILQQVEAVKAVRPAGVD